MALVRAVATAIMLMLSAASHAGALEGDYRGEDGGYLVYSVGTIRIGMQFEFSYRRVALSNGAEANDFKGRIVPKVGGMWTLKVKNPDFSGRETGHVVIRRLPAGRYVIDRFNFGGHLPGVGDFRWSPERPFALPFDIKPNRTTYVGSFMRAPSLGTALQPTLGAVGFFVITDRSARDLPVARAKLTTLPEADVQVTDVDAFAMPILRTREPE